MRCKAILTKPSFAYHLKFARSYRRGTPPFPGNLFLHVLVPHPMICFGGYPLPEDHLK